MYLLILRFKTFVRYCHQIELIICINSINTQKVQIATLNLWTILSLTIFNKMFQASGKGYRNKTELRGQTTGETEAAGSDNKIKKKPVLRPEYNPLMGDAGSSSGSNFRRRGLGGAGGGGG